MQARLRRRRLPHFDLPGGTYFVTSCLAGSIPAEGLLRLREVQNEWLSHRPKDRSPGWKVRLWKAMFVERERWLDQTPAARHLESPALGAIVAQSLQHFHQVRYELIAFVVMPSHIHWLFRPLADWASTVPAEKSPRELILHSILSFTANECNKALNRSGAFWQGESYDHCVRDEGELKRIVDYIEMNPVKAGLCQRPEEWKISSAYEQALA